MKYIWSFIDRKNWTAQTKYRAAAAAVTVIAAIAGVTAWTCLRHFFLSSMEWMLCFAGYGAAGSWIFLFLYSCSHTFHNGPHTSGPAS